MIRILLIFIVSSLKAYSCHAIDLQPGEIAAPKNSMTLIQTSVQYSERGDFFQNGKRINSDTSIKSINYIVRIAKTFFINDLPAVVYAQSAAGNITTDNIPQPSPFFRTDTRGDSGPSDTSFAFAVWPYANHESKSYYGVAAYLNIPTGSYDSKRLFNMGSNRLQYALQTGYQTQLLNNLHWMVAWDIVYSTKNDEFLAVNAKLEQSPIQTIQSGFKFDLSNQYSIAVALFNTYGGETTLNEVDRNDSLNLTRYQVSLQSNQNIGRFLIQYGSDLKTENKFFEDHRLILRYMVGF
jgi:hypothetical protein